MHSVLQKENGRSGIPRYHLVILLTDLPNGGEKNAYKERTNDIMIPKFLASIDPFRNPRAEKLTVGTTEECASYKY